jgi:hypothetical protein
MPQHHQLTITVGITALSIHSSLQNAITNDFLVAFSNGRLGCLAMLQTAAFSIKGERNNDQNNNTVYSTPQRPNGSTELSDSGAYRDGVQLPG